MKKITVTLPQGCSPSEMIEVMTAVKSLEDKFEVVVEFEKPVGQKQDGFTPRSADIGFPAVDIPGALPSGTGTPSALDLIGRPIPGMEEEEIESRRRVVRDD